MRNFKLVCLGDSLTEGYDIDLTKRWTNALAKELHIPVINSGISGDTTSGMLSRFYQDVLLHQPSHLIIMGGSNDLSHNLSDESIISNLKAIVRQAQHHGIECIMGIPTPYYYDTSHTGCNLFLSSTAYHDRLVMLQSKLRTFVAYYDLPFVDFSSGMSDDLFLADGVHPNEEGQVVMTQIALKVFEKIFA